MDIRTAKLNFHNVISAKSVCTSNEWMLAAIELRNTVIKNGLYGTGPIIYQVSSLGALRKKKEYTFYLPINRPVEIPEREDYRFINNWVVDNALYFRHVDPSVEIRESYDLLRNYAEDSGLTLEEPFYNVYIDVYHDEPIIDILAPIIGTHSG